MPNIQGQKKWSEVRLLETHELARGGVNGNLNEQAKALADRTELLMEEKASKAEIIQGVFEFGTYAEFDSAKASLPLNCTVVIGEENTTGTGQWGIGNNSWNGSVLKKSAFDPVLKSEKDATKKMVQGSKNHFDLAYFLNPILYAPGGNVEKIITSETVKLKYTQTASSGVNGFGFSTSGIWGTKVSATIDLSKVDLSNVHSVYVSQWGSSGNLNKNIVLENIGNNIFSVQNAPVDANATYVRLFVRTNNIVDHVIEIENIDLVFDTYSRYRDDSLEKKQLLNSNTVNLIDEAELSALAPLQVTNTSRVSTQVTNTGDLIATITKTSAGTHNAGTRINVSALQKISFGVWVKDNANFLNVELWRDATASASITLSKPLYTVDGWSFYAAFGIDVSAFDTYEFRVRFNANATDTQFKNPVFTTNMYAANWVQKSLSETSKAALTAKAVEAVTPLIPTNVPNFQENAINLSELFGIIAPSHISSSKNVTTNNGVTSWQGVSTNASSVGFFIDRDKSSDKVAFSVDVKDNPNFINVILQHINSAGSAVKSTTLTKSEATIDGEYLKFNAINIEIDAAITRFRFYVRFTGVADAVYEFKNPKVVFNKTDVELVKVNEAFVKAILDSIPDGTTSETDKIKFNNISHAVAWIKNPLIHSGAKLNSNGTITDTFDGRYFSVWGSSSAQGLYSRLDTYARSTLGCTATWNGGQGGESSDLTSARAGARPCRIAFNGGSIPASDSVEVQHTLGLGFGLGNLKPFVGKVSVFGIDGTLAYDASLASNLKFTRTNAGSSISVPADMYFDFIPSFNNDYMNGWGIVWAGKNDIGRGNQFGAEELLQRTIEIYSQFKPMFKRVLVFDHWANSTWDQDAKWAEIQKINSLYKQYFGKYLFSVHDYIMSEQVWIDTGITPTANDLLLQSKRMLASSLSSDGQHLNGAVNDQIILKLNEKYQSLGWI